MNANDVLPYVMIMYSQYIISIVYNFSQCLFFCTLQHDELISNRYFDQIRWSASLTPLFYTLSTFPSVQKLPQARWSCI